MWFAKEICSHAMSIVTGVQAGYMSVGLVEFVLTVTLDSWQKGRKFLGCKAVDGEVNLQQGSIGCSI